MILQQFPFFNHCYVIAYAKSTKHMVMLKHFVWLFKLFVLYCEHTRPPPSKVLSQHDETQLLALKGGLFNELSNLADMLFVQIKFQLCKVLIHFQKLMGVRFFEMSSSASCLLEFVGTKIWQLLC